MKPHLERPAAERRSVRRHRETVEQPRIDAAAVHEEGEILCVEAALGDAGGCGSQWVRQAQVGQWWMAIQRSPVR